MTLARLRARLAAGETSAAESPAGPDAGLVQGQAGQADEQQAGCREHRAGSRAARMKHESDSKKNGSNYGEHLGVLQVRDFNGLTPAKYLQDRLLNKPALRPGDEGQPRISSVQ